MKRYPRFISIEGGEGAGKSTVLKALLSALQADGVADVISTREPGGTALAEQIRALLLQQGEDAPTAQAELLLLFAARNQHVQKKILPALQRGAWVICDRFSDSSYAYQGAGRGIDSALIKQLDQHVVGIVPALTFLLDVDVAIGRARALQRANAQAVGPDRMETEDMEFHQRIRAAFLQRAAQDPARFCVIDASLPAAEVAAQAQQALRQLRQTTEQSA